MKNLFIVSAAFLFSSVLLSSCKKDSGKESDFSDLFKNTEWVGEIKYKIELSAEPFIIRFKNGTFEWHELSGSYGGVYEINTNERKITLQFTGVSNAKLTASITQDNKFMDIVPAASYPWTINSCKLNKGAASQNLDNTLWKGKSPTGLNIQFRFISGSKVKSTNLFLTGPEHESPYYRDGNIVRFDMPFGPGLSYFLILQPKNANILVGTYGHINPTRPFTYFSNFELTKQ